MLRLTSNILTKFRFGSHLAVDRIKGVAEQFLQLLRSPHLYLVSSDFTGCCPRHPYFRDVVLADKITDIGDILGGIACMRPEADSYPKTVFTSAKEKYLDPDFPTDIHKIKQNSISIALIILVITRF